MAAAKKKAPDGVEATGEATTVLEVQGTTETMDGVPAEGELIGSPDPLKGDEVPLAPLAPETPPAPPPDEAAKHDGDAPPPTEDEPLRELTHEESVLLEQAISLAIRRAEHDGLDGPTEEDLIHLRRQVHRDVLHHPELVARFIAETTERLPPPAIVGYRVWEQGQFHHDGKVYRPGDVVDLPKHLAERHGPVLEPITKE